MDLTKEQKIQLATTCVLAFTFSGIMFGFSWALVLGSAIGIAIGFSISKLVGLI